MMAKASSTRHPDPNSRVELIEYTTITEVLSQEFVPEQGQHLPTNRLRGALTGFALHIEILKESL